jgi:hypothetical protein
VLRVFFKNTITSFQDRYHRTDGRSVATEGLATDGSSSVPLEMVRQKSVGTSISSVPGAEELGMVITNERGGILQTNTVTVVHAPNPHGRILEWRDTEVLSNYRY